MRNLEGYLMGPVRKWKSYINASLFFLDAERSFRADEDFDLTKCATRFFLWPMMVFIHDVQCGPVRA